MKANRQWLIRFFALVLALCVVCAAATVVIDPFCYYRLTDRPYFANIFFLSPGMIRHADYETVLLGSSMALHFDPAVLDDALHTRTLKICENGMNVTEQRALLAALRDANRVKRCIICLDMDYYRFTKPPESKYPLYLLNKTRLDDFKYWFNYDVWFKYLPMDAANVVLRRGGSVTERYREIGLLKSTEGYNEAAVFNVVEKVKNEELTDRQRGDLEAMIPNFDVTLHDYLEAFDSQTQIVLFLPPISVARWYLYERNGAAPYLYEFRRHVAEAAAQHENITLYDFQGCDFTNDLSLYRDAVHYNYTINDFMSYEFAKPDYAATPGSVVKTNAQITENVRQFKQKYSEKLQ